MSKINRDFLEFISREDPTCGIFFQFLTGKEIVAFGSTCRNASALMRNAEFEVTISLTRMLEKPHEGRTRNKKQSLVDVRVLPNIDFLPIEKCILDIPLIHSIVDEIKDIEPSVWSRFRAFNIGTGYCEDEVDVSIDYDSDDSGNSDRITIESAGLDLIPLFENAKSIKSIRIGSARMLRSLRGLENKISSAVLLQSVPAPRAPFLTLVPYEVDQDRYAGNKHLDPDLLRFATYIRSIIFFDGFQVNDWLEHASKTGRIELHARFFSRSRPEDIRRLIDAKRRLNVQLELESGLIAKYPELEPEVDAYVDHIISLREATRNRTPLHKFKYLYDYSIEVYKDNLSTIQQSLNMIVNLPSTLVFLIFDVDVQNMDFGDYEYSAEFEEACKRIKRIWFDLGSRIYTTKIDLRLFLGFFPNLESLTFETNIPRSLETLKTFFILPENPPFEVKFFF